jgi:hypothetical protein
MTYYVNNTGKILGATVVAAAVTQAATGKDTGLARGCFAVLFAWLFWVGLVLSAIYYLIFG